ncbi:putative transcription factor C2H2 family [Helianthus anomalus]
MSNHLNNTRQLSRYPSNAYARYINGSRVNFDFISPPSPPFPPTLNERVGVDPWLWSLSERNLSLPSSIISFPRPRMQLVVFRNNVANNSNMRSRPMEQSRQQHSELTPNEQRKALMKLRKEIFNPTPKKIIQRLGKFYRQKDATKAYVEDDDDDDKKCVICLEDFEPKEVVMVTPCNHMFHEDCILPWVKSNGKCPVCRFSLCGSDEESGASSTNNDNVVNNRLPNELVSFVTSRGGSATIEPFWF